MTVAEVSGDNHAALFIAALRQLDPDVQIEGYGGPAMAEAGAVIHHETVARAAMTFHAARRLFEMARLLRATRRRYRAAAPDLHVCVDSSGVNLHFARLAHRAGVPVLYYVAPQVWASRERRVKKLRRYVDRVACILPFEEPYFRRHEVNATFVGHPLFDALPDDRLARVPARRFPQRSPIIGIIPGSRRSEVRENLPPLLRVAHRLRVEHQDARFVLPTTPAVHEIARHLVPATLDVDIRVNAFDELIPGCDLCLCKSGTATLHVAAYGVPMVVVYRIHPAVWQLVGRFLVKTRKIALVNILAGQQDLVPEFVPWYGDVEPVARAALDLLGDPQRLEAQRRQLLELVRPLDRRGAGERAARLALEMMDERRPAPQLVEA